MKTIQELLASMNQTRILSVTPEASVMDAVTTMVENNVGAILILEGEQIKGIMSERDYLRFIADRGHTARDTPVTELMTRKIIYTTPASTLNQVMAIMTEARIRHIPVLEGGKLLGIVSIGDIVKQVASNQEAHINFLEEYISDSYPG
jgi:CBS domain-containing protein